MDELTPKYDPKGQLTGWTDPSGNLYNPARTVVLIPIDRALRDYAERRALEDLAALGMVPIKI